MKVSMDECVIIFFTFCFIAAVNKTAHSNPL